MIRVIRFWNRYTTQEHTYLFMCRLQFFPGSLFPQHCIAHHDRAKVRSIPTMSRLPANKQLLACGHNESGNLSFLPHCPRWYINGQNPCEHNAWTSDGRSYCSRMVLRPTHVLWTNNIRVIGSFPKSSFLDINGCWQVLPPYLALRARFDYPAGKDIKRLFEFDGRTKLGFYTNNGCLWILDLLKCGLKGLSVHFTTWRRQILHLCFGGYVPAVLVVHKAAPNVITHFNCFGDCLAWLVECPQPGGIMAFSLAMLEPIAQIVGNLSAFTIRLERGRVYTWDVDAFAHSPLVVNVVESSQPPTPDPQEIRTDIDSTPNPNPEKIPLTESEANEGLQAQSPQGLSPRTEPVEITFIEPVHAPAPDLQEIRIDGDSTPNLTPKETPLRTSDAEEDPQAQTLQGLSPERENEIEPDTQSHSKSKVDPPIRTEQQSAPPLKTEPDPKIDNENEPAPQTLFDSLVDPRTKVEPRATPPPEFEPPPPISPWSSDTSLHDSSSNPPSPPRKPTIPSIRRMVLPPSTHLTAARFLTGSLSHAGVHLWRDPTTDDPSAPQLSHIGTPAAPILQYVGDGIRLIDVSISAHHIVAVAESGEVFSKGRGWHGELGIGEKVFDIRSEEADGEDGGKEFAEGWVGMDTGDVREGMRIRRVYTGEGTTFLVAEKIGEEGANSA